MMSVRADDRAGAAAGRAATTFSQGQADRTQAKADAAERAQVGVALFKEQHPDATDAQLAAVRAGIIKPAEKPEKPVYKPIGPAERAALSTKAVADSGKPKGDLMTGREIENQIGRATV